ncbi:hypothetical protein AVEN_169618-1 [Araneus ventricosus]|uniref:Uncharacterized protein n=1 Tax=Araneus ventricosus TaxID=182803 RepID=A0A4Y2TZI6_ARAVE|nr:hypothetical protein AVEN_169618-1 [Araneus ventricosus]
MVSKEGRSPLLHFGIFGTREGKTNRQGRKPMKFGANELEVMEFQRTQNPNPFADSNLGPRCEASGKTIILPRLAPRVEAINETRIPSCGREEFCDFEPCLKTNFGTSVNTLPNFSD